MREKHQQGPAENESGPWNCWFSGEFRICEDSGGSSPGDGGGWFCYDTPSGRECRQRNPEYPDDSREWDCHDAEDGSVICSATTRPSSRRGCAAAAR